MCASFSSVDTLERALSQFIGERYCPSKCINTHTQQQRDMWISSRSVLFLLVLNGWHWFRINLNGRCSTSTLSCLMDLFLCVLIVALVAGNPDRYVERGGARVYLLCPHHAARVLQWLQWWLRGEEEGSRLLLIKPCKCKMQPPSRDSAARVGPGMSYTCSPATQPNSEECDMH